MNQPRLFKTFKTLLLTAGTLGTASGRAWSAPADQPENRVGPAASGAIAARAADATMKVRFPLRASANGRYLVDAGGKPFFYQADTPWMLLQNLSLAEAEEYMDDRKARGFSALQIMLTGFMGMKNRVGQLPFEGDDLSRPNEAFFAHADQVIQKAADKGMLLMIAPLWSGCCGEGWAGKDQNGKLKPLNANGPGKAHEWGRWLGQRYGKFNNVAWLMGGDHNPDESFEAIRQLARGIHEAAAGQLMAVHNAPNNASAAFYDEEPWLSLNAAYTYEEVFKHIQGEWNRTRHVRPIFLAESGYEHEANDKRQGTPFRLRRQAYGAVLSGALAGHAYGHRDLWRVASQWRQALGDVGSQQMSFVRRLFATRAWWKLEPEAGTDLVTQGRGTPGEDGFITAARASDGSLAMVYAPQARAFTINMARLSGPIRASWFDPTEGTLQPARIGVLPALGLHQWMPPQKNAAGDSDWVLLLERAL